MTDMRKLMEAVEQLTESWDPGAIADAIYKEITDDWENPVKDAFSNPDEPEPYRAAIYTYGKLSGLYNPETLDGSEIYHSIVDSLEDKFWEKVTPDDIKRAQLGEDELGEAPARNPWILMRGGFQIPSFYKGKSRGSHWDTTKEPSKARKFASQESAIAFLDKQTWGGPVGDWKAVPLADAEKKQQAKKDAQPASNPVKITAAKKNKAIKDASGAVASLFGDGMKLKGSRIVPEKSLLIIRFAPVRGEYPSKFDKSVSALRKQKMFKGQIAEELEKLIRAKGYTLHRNYRTKPAVNVKLQDSAWGESANVTFIIDFEGESYTGRLPSGGDDWPKVMVDEDAYESVNEDGSRRVWHAGPVEVMFSPGEVSMYHGHGENMFLSDDEFNMFINAIGQLGEE